MGQIYIKQVNWALMFATIALVLAFESSSALAAAYGIAVTATMGITTVLAYVISRHVWGWSRAGRRVLVTIPLFWHRPGLLRRQRPEDRARRVGAAAHRVAHLSC